MRQNWKLQNLIFIEMFYERRRQKLNQVSRWKLSAMHVEVLHEVGKNLLIFI